MIKTHQIAEVETHSIKAQNIQPGMVLDFGQYPGVQSGPEGETVILGEAEVISVETPDGLSDEFGLWVSPEDGSVSEVYVSAYGWQTFAIVG